MNTRKNNIAVFIPCYNAARTIAETLKSVKAAIEHIGFRVPVYIYDDCSKDDTLEIVNQAIADTDYFTIRKNDENLGERKTANNAFDYFSGKYEWVFIIHADDIAKPDWLSVMYENIEQVEPGCFTIWSSFDSLDNASRKITAGDNTGMVAARNRTEEEIIGYITTLYSSWHISGAAFNLSHFQKLKGFDIALAQFGDTDFFFRGLLAGYHDIYISRTLTYYRIFSGSVSSVSNKTNRDIREIYMLMNKFCSVLNAEELGKMHRVIQKLSMRRTIKSVGGLHLKSAIVNSRIFLKSLYQQMGLKRN